MTRTLRVLRQLVAPTGRHRGRGVVLVDEPGGLAVNSRSVLGEEELLGPRPAPERAPGAAVAQCFDDCHTCRRATAGVLTRDGWTCGECLTPQVAGEAS